MKIPRLKAHHKCFGLILSFFLLLFCISGIVLNHRAFFSPYSLSRGALPSSYSYRAWNQGLMRGGLDYVQRDGDTLRLVYGGAGVFCLGKDGAVEDFNRGMPAGADRRMVRALAQTEDGVLFAAAQFDLMWLDGFGEWHVCGLPKSPEERMSDLIVRGDTLIALGRNHLYMSFPPYREFGAMDLRTPEGYEPEVSLFRTVWTLHSGELFGLVGRLVVDAIAIILVLLIVTGIMFWLLPKGIRFRRRRGKGVSRGVRWLKRSFSWHTKVGRATIVLTLFITITGLSLRPPLLIALVKMSVPTIPGTALHHANPWQDRLRMLRYDAKMGGYLLSSSAGFYFLDELDSVPEFLGKYPPVSSMGLNAWERLDDSTWVVGSFNGAYRWRPQDGVAYDYFTGEDAPRGSVRPFGRFPVQGFARGADGSLSLVHYQEGTSALPMPGWMAGLPLSLWHLALEVHTGRIFTFMGMASLVWPFVAGLAIAWMLWTGYRLTRPRRGKKG